MNFGGIYLDFASVTGFEFRMVLVSSLKDTRSTENRGARVFLPSFGAGHMSFQLGQSFSSTFLLRQAEEKGLVSLTLQWGASY